MRMIDTPPGVALVATGIADRLQPLFTDMSQRLDALTHEMRGVLIRLDRLEARVETLSTTVAGTTASRSQR